MLWAAYAQVEFAELLAGRGEKVEDAALLDEASKIAADLEMPRLQARIDALDLPSA